TPTGVQIVSQFKTQVLIEPAVVGGWQITHPSDCPPGETDLSKCPDRFNRAEVPPGMTGANCKPDNTASDGMGGTKQIACWMAAPGVGGVAAVVPTCDA